MKNPGKFNPETGGTAVINKPASGAEKTPKKRGRSRKIDLEPDMVVPVIGEPIMVIPKEEMKVPGPSPEETKAERIKKIQERVFGAEGGPSSESSTREITPVNNPDFLNQQTEPAPLGRAEQVNKMSKVPEKESFSQKIRRLLGYTPKR